MIDLVVENDKRKEAMEKLTDLEILDKVKTVLMLGNTDFVTIKMGADYYEVDVKTIEKLIERNKAELEENGLKLYSKKEFLNRQNVGLKNNEQLKGKSILTFEDGNQLTYPNRGLLLISKRVLLNIGMLLRDSEVAKELRRRILDIAFDAEEGKGSIETITKEINEEELLKMELGDAIVSGDMDKYIKASLKLSELKNKRIVELENEIEVTNEK